MLKTYIIYMEFKLRIIYLSIHLPTDLSLSPHLLPTEYLIPSQGQTSFFKTWGPLSSYRVIYCDCCWDAQVLKLNFLVHHHWTKVELFRKGVVQMG